MIDGKLVYQGVHRLSDREPIFSKKMQFVNRDIMCAYLTNEIRKTVELERLAHTAPQFVIGG